MKGTALLVFVPAVLFLAYQASFPICLIFSMYLSTGISCQPVDVYDALGTEKDYHNVQLHCAVQGTVAEQYRSGTAEKCAAQCRAHPMCAFWTYGAASRNCQLLDRSAAVNFVPVRSTVCGAVKRPTAEEELAESGLKIDVVYTWINGSHPDIIDARNQFHTDKKQPLEESMVRDYHVLKYSLRSVEKYMPWVNHIYIVVNQNVAPEWFNFDQDYVTIVPHEEIFPDPMETLPTFNSRAIESALRYVNTASDCFIYMNDDQLVSRPRYPSEFCNLKTGVPNAFTEAHSTGSWDTHLSKWALTLDKTNNHISKMLKTVQSRRFTWHGPISLSKAAYRLVHDGMPEAINATYRHRFRNVTDIMTPLTNTHVSISMLNATVVSRAWSKTGLLFGGFVNNIPRNQALMDKMEGEHVASVCLNDHFGKKQILDDVLDHIEMGLTSYLPNPSIAEKLDQ